MALFGRSRVRHAQGKRAEAIADLDGAIRIAPGFAEAWGLRGVIKLEEKRRAEALADLQKAVELKPSLKAAFGPSLHDAGRDGFGLLAEADDERGAASRAVLARNADEVTKARVVDAGGLRCVQRIAGAVGAKILV